MSFFSVGTQKTLKTPLHPYRMSDAFYPKLKISYILYMDIITVKIRINYYILQLIKGTFLMIVGDSVHLKSSYTE